MTGRANDGDAKLTPSVVIWLIVWVVGVLVFVTLPLTGGIGAAILMYGMEAVRAGVFEWIVWWAIGSMAVVLIAAGAVEALFKWKFPDHHLLKEVCSYSVGLVVLVLSYFGFFYQWSASVVAALISFGLYAVLLWVIKRFPAPNKSME